MKIKLKNPTTNDLKTECFGKPVIIKAGETIDIHNDKLAELKRKHHFLQIIKIKDSKEDIKNSPNNILNRPEFKEKKKVIEKEAKEHGYLPSQEKKLKEEAKKKKVVKKSKKSK